MFLTYLKELWYFFFLAGGEGLKMWKYCQEVEKT